MRRPSLIEGQGLVEYALLLTLIAIVVIAVLVLLGPTIGNVFSLVVEAFQDPASAAADPEPDPEGASLGSGWLGAMVTIMALTHALDRRKRPSTEAAT